MQTLEDLANTLKQHRCVFLSNAVAARIEYDPKTRKNITEKLRGRGGDLERHVARLTATFGNQKEGIQALRWIEVEGNRPDCVPPIPDDWPLAPPGWEMSLPFWILSQSAAEAIETSAQVVEIVAKDTNDELDESCFKLFDTLRSHQLVVTAGRLAWQYWPELESFLEELRQLIQKGDLRVKAEEIIERRGKGNRRPSLDQSLSELQQKILVVHQKYEDKRWHAPTYRKLVEVLGKDYPELNHPEKVRREVQKIERLLDGPLPGRDKNKFRREVAVPGEDLDNRPADSAT